MRLRLIKLKMKSWESPCEMNQQALSWLCIDRPSSGTFDTLLLSFSFQMFPSPSSTLLPTTDDLFGSFGEASAVQNPTRKAPPIESTLPCSLEELYKGTTKKMKISREILDISG
ncbi:dnaJ subfamily B member 13-like protein [Cinnamomum micranthum f. kanehirae]|uniref:DnaJ subfamily B member 13-like protein n=1 Tax=Cinnamomum micranthum f. kanehirae TaxID=337451 RepID=A0A3S3R9T3_9MAGN|nr:dnaJ subfamily B member 13-like protein [Cinnamomum micranthum f. kanehirae]